MKRLFSLCSALTLWGTLLAANPTDSIVYHNALDFELQGKAFTHTEGDYDRLPVWLKDSVRTPVWDLSKCSTGMYVRFRTNASSINVRYHLLLDRVMNHMAMTGIKGVDLYMLQNQHDWRYLMTARPKGKVNEMTLVSNMDTVEMREFMLYLPLYDGIESLYIGVPQQASLAKPAVDLPQKEKPIVVYGTSITQGGCASRTGMAYTNILSRKLNRQFINLGFSGNGRQDMEVAQAMDSIDAGCIIIDCIPNCTLDEVKTKTLPFIRHIRKAHPGVPVVMVEGPIFPNQLVDKYLSTYLPSKNEAFYEAFQTMQAENPHFLYFMKSDDFAFDLEGTVDAVHLTDLGFMRMAEVMFPMLKRLLNE